MLVILRRATRAEGSPDEVARFFVAAGYATLAMRAPQNDRLFLILTTLGKERLSDNDDYTVDMKKGAEGCLGEEEKAGRERDKNPKKKE